MNSSTLSESGQYAAYAIGTPTSSDMTDPDGHRENEESPTSSRLLNLSFGLQASPRVSEIPSASM